MNAKERVKQILKDCCAGNASLATDILHEEFVIIHRDELPSVKRSMHDPKMYYVDNQNIVFTSAENARAWVMRDIAVWQFIEHEASVLAAQEAEASAARDRRRDEIMGELNSKFTYKELGGNPFAKAVDRIIDLELAACE